MKRHPRSRQSRSARATRLLLASVALAFVSSSVAVEGARALRVVSYNLLNYDNQFSARDPAFRTVLSGIGGIDVLTVQEIQDGTAVNRFYNNVLNVIEPGQWSIATFFDDPSQSFNQGMYYRTAAVSVVEADTLGNSPRDIAYYTIRPAGYTSSEAELTLFITHFKAGSSSGDEGTRLNEAQLLRAFMNSRPDGSNMLVCGDFNMQESTESAYQQMTASQADNTGRVFDPVNTPGSWHDNFNFRFIHTQSTRTGLLDPNDGGATGGMDDRFDFILTTSPLSDGEGLDELSNTYSAYGQDGSHFNSAISDAPTIPEGQPVADALERASDHLPVFMDFQVPPVAGADASLNFGTVIVGATAEQTLNVSNEADAPADELDYTLIAVVGFTVPGGSFQAEAEAGPNAHTIGMVTTFAGNKAGSITVSSDDPDTPSLGVSASGTVLDHAVPSLASGSQVLADTVDFGSFEEGMFSDQSVDAHNFGFDALQALLNVHDAQIAGGGGRFSIVGGFSPSDVGGAPESYGLHFDDAGAATGDDTTYAATLTFSTRDQQGLPGALDADDLTVELRATVLGSQTGVGDPGSGGPSALRANVPNPFSGSTRIRFDLAEGGEVWLAVYDVRGRLVRTLADGSLAAGGHDMGWAGVTDGGSKAAPGVYFFVLKASGYTAARRMVKLR